jgi:hypothetical protein
VSAIARSPGPSAASGHPQAGRFSPRTRSWKGSASFLRLFLPLTRSWWGSGHLDCASPSLSHLLLEGQCLHCTSPSPSHLLLEGQCLHCTSPSPSHLLLEGQRLYCTSPSLSHLLLEGQRPYCTSPSLSHLLLEGQCLHARDDRELDAGALDCAAHHLARQEMREEHGARLGIIGRSSVPSNELFVEITSGDSTYQYSY